ncbi:YIP1 family protein [bacterium]|nr:YIP1 family protein [bacterium]
MHESAVAPDPPAPGRAPFLGLGYVVGAFSASARAFRDLAAAPRGAWIGPLILCSLLAMASSWIMLPEVLESSYTTSLTMMEKLGVPEAEMDEALERIPLEPDRGVMIQSVYSRLVLTPLFLLLGAAFVHLVSRMFGSESRFGPTFGMYSVAAVVPAVGSVVQAAVVAASDTVEVTLGPGALLPDVDYFSPLGIFLDLFNVFSIWHLIVLVTGISVVTRVQRGTGWSVGLSYWVVVSLVVAAMKGAVLWSRGG